MGAEAAAGGGDAPHLHDPRQDGAHGRVDGSGGYGDASVLQGKRRIEVNKLEPTVCASADAHTVIFVGGWIVITF